MKQKTLKLLKPYINNRKFLFHDDKPKVDIFLTDDEVRELLKAEYNYAPKTEKTLHKNLEKLLDQLLREALEDYKKTDKIIEEAKEVHKEFDQILKKAVKYHEGKE